MDKETQRKIEAIVVKVWDMSKAAVSPLAEPEGEQVVRSHTLGWAGDQILAIIHNELPKDKPPLVSWAMEDVSKEVANELIQAQREADIKHYEGVK